LALFEREAATLDVGEHRLDAPARPIVAHRCEHHLWHIRNWSLWLDLKTVRLTAARGLPGASAY